MVAYITLAGSTPRNATKHEPAEAGHTCRQRARRARGPTTGREVARWDESANMRS